MKIPDKWENYEAIGKLISGTRFIAFKVPLAEKFNRHLPLGVAPFTPHLLVEEVKRQNFKLGLVIDLTNTNKYYLDKLITDQGVRYKKIYTEGHKVPNTKVIKQFFAAVDTFLKENNDNSDVIGVHCTHGINRTGYLICRYMINRMNMAPDKSVKAFNEGRGHAIERENYLADLYNPDRKLIEARSVTNKEDDGEEEEEEEEVDESSSAAAETWSGHGNGQYGQQLGKRKFHNDADSYGHNNGVCDNNNMYNSNVYNNAYYNNAHRFNYLYNRDNSYNRPSYNHNYNHNNTYNNNRYNSPRPAYKQNDFNSYNRYNISSDMNDDINNNGDIKYDGLQQQQPGHQNHHNNSNTACTTSNSGWLNFNSPYYKSFSMSTTNNFQKINDRDNNFGNSIHTNDINNYSNTQNSFTGYKQKYTNTNSRYNAYNSNNSRFQNDKHRYNNPNYDRHHHDTNQGALHDDVTSDVNVIPPYSKKQRQF